MPDAFLCLMRASPRAKRRPHLLHKKGRSPVWSIKCRLRSWILRNFDEQVSQVNFFSCECITKCDFKLLWRVKVCWQWGQEYFFEEGLGPAADCGCDWSGMGWSTESCVEIDVCWSFSDVGSGVANEATLVRVAISDMAKQKISNDN